MVYPYLRIFVFSQLCLFSIPYCLAELLEPTSNTTAPVYSVMRILPNNTKQFNLIRGLYDNASKLNLNFWKTSKTVNGFWDVMAGESAKDILLDQLKSHKINFMTTISDVESLIRTKEGKKHERRFRDDSGAPTYDFMQYGSYPQMTEYMRELARYYPKTVQLVTIGTSHEGRTIDGLEIGTRNASKRVFWIDGGIHAREWAAPHTAMYFIHYLTSHYESDATIRQLLTDITFVIVPCVNPDGYEFTRSSTNPHVRLWRKNRSKMQCLTDSFGRKRCCRGVDLNRNFDFHFRESGSSDDPCSEIYQGNTAFSEPESRAIRDAIMSRRYKGRIDGYVTLHTYSQIWIHPYGHRKDAYPGDIQDLYDLAKKSAKALQKLYGTKYVVGSGADTLYPASGGSEDWVKHEAKVKFVYLLELRPDEKNWDGFILDEKDLLPTAKETWEGIRVVAEAVQEKARQMDEEAAATTTTPRPFRFGNGSDGSCYDLRHACKRWVMEREHLCKSVPIFMRENCAYSCGYC